jgi:hypothetical protein
VFGSQVREDVEEGGGVGGRVVRGIEEELIGGVRGGTVVRTDAAKEKRREREE